MSLFGGPQPPPTSPPSAQLATFASSPPPHPSSEPATAPALSIEHHVEDGSDDEFDDDERPNKFSGNVSAWKRHAANELDLQSALSHLAADDISRHLYIAHTLRSHFQRSSTTSIKPYQSKSRWGGAKAQENNWAPPRKWTAWPLEPSEVPRKWERFGEVPEIDPEDEFTIREEGFVKSKPSRDLEELVLSVVLRKAKEQWNSREEERKPRRRKKRIIPQRRNPNDKKKDASAQEIEDFDSSDDEDRQQSRRRGPGNTVSESSSNLQGTRDHHSAQGNIRPVVTADDGAAQRIIQPSMRSLLNNLDSLLAALHRSRQNHIDGVSGTATKTSGSKKRKAADADAEPESQPQPLLKRPRGRPPKVKALEPSESSPAPIPDGPDEQDIGSVKKPMGRPNQFKNRRRPGESYYMMHKRLRAEEKAEEKAEKAEKAAEAAQAAASNCTPVREEPPTPENQTRRSSTFSGLGDVSAAGDGTEKASHISGSRTFGLRDWSEVLGTATLIGAFKPSVVQRAAQRCANIFNEGMKFRTLEEKNALGNDAGEVVQYVPGCVLPPLFDQSSDVEARVQPTEATDVEVSDNEDDTRGEEDETRPLWDGISKNCPHASCERHSIPFHDVKQLRLHVSMKHGYKLTSKASVSRSKAPSSLTKSQTLLNQRAAHFEMEGAVHNDGFLKPIERRSGWRGPDTAQRENRKHGKCSESRSRNTNRIAEQMAGSEDSGVEETDWKPGKHGVDGDDGEDDTD
ncbi:uncharacterized protein J3D65DRAFT_609904 [Phyllosticta citribraziliensis]|uniref:Rrn9 domain-containing protein n=1 Tax=Phyllosticta citribraziliensis TaxID=989973 RepID=A0ABR1MB66_9PEZI